MYSENGLRMFMLVLLVLYWLALWIEKVWLRSDTTPTETPNNQQASTEKTREKTSNTPNYWS